MIITDDDVIKIFDSKNGMNIRECYIKKHNLYVYKDYLYNRFPDIYENTEMKELLYRLKNKIEYVPKCKICGKPAKFQKNYYADTCCKDCGDIYAKQQRDKTNLIKYGTTNIMKTENFINGKKEFLKLYNVENSGQIQEIKEKIKNTNNKKYGVPYCFLLPHIQQKSINAHLGKTLSEETKEKMKNTCIERYGVDNVNKLSEVTQKAKKTRENTCLKKYGVNTVSKVKEFQQKVKNTVKEKYNVDYILQHKEFLEKMQNTCKERYGNSCYAKTLEFKIKSHNTKVKNKSYGKSKLEKAVLDYLYSIYGEDNINYQYMSIEYPYNCDYYIKPLKLYIELQAYWTHNNHPYNKNNIDDINILNYWKSKNTKKYNDAIDTWTRRDIEKRECAKNNNINYLEIFSNNINEIKNIIDNIQK